MQITDMISVNTKDSCRTDNVGKLVAFGSIVQYILMISLFSWFPKRSNTVCPFGNHINKNNNMSCPFQQYTKNMTVHFPEKRRKKKQLQHYPSISSSCKHTYDWSLSNSTRPTATSFAFSTNTTRISIGRFFEQWHKQYSWSLARSFRKQSIPRCYTCFGNKLLATPWTNDWPVIEHRIIAISPIWLLCLGQELCPWIILILAMLLLFFGPIIIEQYGPLSKEVNNSWFSSPGPNLSDNWSTCGVFRIVSRKHKILDYSDRCSKPGPPRPARLVCPGPPNPPWSIPACPSKGQVQCPNIEAQKQ